MLKKGDIVLVNGKTIEIGKKDKINRVLAEVIVCGKYDVFLKKLNANSYESNRPFISSLKKCQKITINNKNFNLDSKKVLPKIGDLVISIYCEFSKTHNVVGTLEKILDVPGSNVSAIIRASDKKVTVPYKSLIILE